MQGVVSVHREKCIIYPRVLFVSMVTGNCLLQLTKKEISELPKRNKSIPISRKHLFLLWEISLKTKTHLVS